MTKHSHRHEHSAPDEVKQDDDASAVEAQAVEAQAFGDRLKFLRSIAVSIGAFLSSVNAGSLTGIIDFFKGLVGFVDLSKVLDIIEAWKALKGITEPTTTPEGIKLRIVAGLHLFSTIAGATTNTVDDKVAEYANNIIGSETALNLLANIISSWMASGTAPTVAKLSVEDSAAVRAAGFDPLTWFAFAQAVYKLLKSLGVL